MFSSKTSLALKADNQDEVDYSDFDEAFPFLCQEYGCSVIFRVERTQANDEFLKHLKLATSTKTRVALEPPSTTVVDRTTEPPSQMSWNNNSDADASEVTAIKAVYDNNDNLVEITLRNIKKMHLAPIQVIGVLAPLFTNLGKLTFDKVGIDVYIMASLHSFLPSSTITEVYFEGVTFGEANYWLLLDDPVRLSALTIKRCGINDEVVKNIASKLYHGNIAGKNLVTLNLAFNIITDVGAKALAEAIRTNRCLRYLNLTNNQLTDEGACHILNVLQTFEMTNKEREEKLKRRNDLTNRDSKTSTASISASLKIKRLNEKQVRITAVDEHPFSDDKVTITKNGRQLCLGNFVLCYINFSYNNLTILTLSKIEEVLCYQSKRENKTSSGLIRVIVDGNNLPNQSKATTGIINYLMKVDNNRSVLARNRRSSHQLQITKSVQSEIL